MMLANRGVDFPVSSPHALHTDPTNDWIDANCYTDLWIELLHRSGLDPYPVLAFSLNVDFEGDQWTFFKPPIEDLRDIYGIDVIELSVYRSLQDHCTEQLDMGRVPLLEADAYYLSDTPATYRTRHTKTTIGVIGIDDTAGQLWYVHNADRFLASGLDYEGILRVGSGASTGSMLTPYVESAKFATVRHEATDRLVTTAVRVAASHVSRRPTTNPVVRFAAHFTADIKRLAAEDMQAYDAYAFATMRQLGASNAIGARFLRWLQANSDLSLTQVADACDELSAAAKLLILKGARAVRTGHCLAVDDILCAMTKTWERIDVGLRAAFDAEGAGGK